MTAEKRPLFRPEAVEHHARSRVGGNRVLDLREGRTAWLFRGLLCALALAVLVAFVVHADTEATGEAVVSTDGTTAVVRIDPRRVSVGQRAGLDFGSAELHGDVTEAGDRVVVRLHGEAPRGARGTAKIRTGRASVAALLLGWD